MIKWIFAIIYTLISLMPLNAQTPFGNACAGTWSGMMQLYSRGRLSDSVSVRLTVTNMATPNAWRWKTEYLSAKLPVVKDYVLRLNDPKTGLYVIDEGNGLEVYSSLFLNKLYSVFETADVLLTSTYELRGNELIFEVTSGKKQSSAMQEITNYAVSNLQRVVFRRTR